VGSAFVVGLWFVALIVVGAGGSVVFVCAYACRGFDLWVGGVFGWCWAIVVIVKLISCWCRCLVIFVFVLGFGGCGVRWVRVDCVFWGWGRCGRMMVLLVCWLGVVCRVGGMCVVGKGVGMIW